LDVLGFQIKGLLDIHSISNELRKSWRIGNQWYSNESTIPS